MLQIKQILRVCRPILFLLGVNGCTSHHDPLEEFRAFADKVAKELPSVTDRAKAKPTITKPCAVDVRKTDSLISPYTAILTFSFSVESKAKNGDVEDTIVHGVEAHYAYQQNIWVPKSVVIKCDDLVYVSGSRSRFSDLKRYMVGRILLELEGADIEKSTDELVQLLGDTKPNR